MARVPTEYDPEADVLEQGAYELEDEGVPDPLPDPRIIDLTPRSDKSHRKGRREPKTVYALVLHQMACCFSPRNPLERFLTIGSHFAIANDGRILQLHPISALVWASNGFNARSVAVEFAGNFPNIKGTWWKGTEYGRNRPTPAQVDAGRYLIRYLMRAMGLTHILAHRQSSGTRENDPGPEVWFHVGQWAVNTLGLKDGGPGFKIGTGNPIPNEWRTWGRPPVTPEVDAALETESPDTEIAHDVWEQEDEARSPEYVRWVQRSLNEVMGLRLPVDGLAGPATRGAVRSFQARNALPVSGIAGTDTADALKAARERYRARSKRRHAAWARQSPRREFQ
jgi:N-acetyl-anhydromuramyl-L-alanine amidase AmpD